MNMMLTMMMLMTSALIMLLTNIIAKKTFMDREKSSPFECGFDPKSFSRIPFSLQFFLIGIIFLIFDMELVLIMPMMITMKLNSMISFSITSTTIILTLMISVLHEWNQGMLEWTK
uniref:NADH-ubiquinone oxidoreductase chain 3 n=1 Tax=Iberobaenia minuta TaxID=1857294 RepID=A0A3G1DH95_9COLE|nr:NADH deshydrogenase subunit 3 [Iberobaenia minuta]